MILVALLAHKVRRVMTSIKGLVALLAHMAQLTIAITGPHRIMLVGAITLLGG